MIVTVKQYKYLLEEMKKVYPYDEEKAGINIIQGPTSVTPTLEIRTKDEKTGVTIVMSKSFDGRDGE